MIDRDDLGSWLAGPQRPHADSFWPGKDLGLPESGSGSVGSIGRRVLALCLDWAMCLAISIAFFDNNPWATLGIFAVENLILVATIGTTVGHRICGIRVVSLRGGAVGVVASLVRTALLCMVIPAAIFNRDHRGLHDLAAATIVQRR